MVQLSRVCGVALLLALAWNKVLAQSADWQAVIWREPQVRYLLANLTLNGGKTELYRKYATEERDPDSREAIRLWDAGARAVNTNEFERKWIASQFAKDGRVMRIVQRGTDRTITGNEVVLSSDGAFAQGPMRLALLDLTLGGLAKDYAERAKKDAAVAEALRRFSEGERVLNAHLFERDGKGAPAALVFKGNGQLADPAFIRLNSDLPYPEVNVRYFLADMFLGGSRDFYWRTAEIAHEVGCLEAVLRFDDGLKI